MIALALHFHPCVAIIASLFGISGLCVAANYLFAPVYDERDLRGYSDDEIAELRALEKRGL